MKENKDILVTIIIPIYNVQEYIENCLESVLAQSYSRLEVLLIDDCGNDRSISIVREWLENRKSTIASKNIQFSVLTHKYNKGLSAARNTGIRRAKGKFLYFLDSDDYITANCIEIMIEKFKEYPKSEIVFAGTIPPSVKRLDNYLINNLPSYSNNKDWCRNRLLKPSLIGVEVWNRLISKSFIISNNLYFAEGISYEDTVWNFDCSKFISACSFCKANTYYYTIRDNGIVNALNKNNEEKRQKLIEVFKTKVKHLDNNCSIDHCIALWNELYSNLFHNFNAKERKQLRKLIKDVATHTSYPTKIIIYFSSLLNSTLYKNIVINWVFSKFNKLSIPTSAIDLEK